MENILLTNVPDFVDQWVLQSTPCGALIEVVDINPTDPSKVMLRTRGRENAIKIASSLDNYNLYGSVIRARYAFYSSTDPPKVAPNVSVSAVSEKQPESASHKQSSNNAGRKQSETKSRDKPEEKRREEKTPTKRSEKVVNLDRSSAPDPRPRQSSRGTNEKVKRTVMNRIDAAAVAAHSSKPDKRPATPSTPKAPSSRKDGRHRESVPVNGSQPKEDLAKRACRFCHLPGHWTWHCQENAEFYRVSETVEGRNPTGYTWPESSIVKAEGLHAGPVVEYFEKFHLQLEKLSQEQIRIMFAWLLNFYVCHTCGAAGHSDYNRLCKYLPIKEPVTEEMLIEERRPFCRRMRGIRDHVPFGKLQQYARIRNHEFREWIKNKDGKDLKYTEKIHDDDHDHIPEPETANSAAAKDQEKSTPPAETSGFIVAVDGKRIKLEPPEDIFETLEEPEIPEHVLRDPRERRRFRHGNHSQENHSSSARNNGGTWACK